MDNRNNMSVFEIIQWTDVIRPNGFGDAYKLKWLNEIEGLIQTEIMGIDPSKILQHVTHSSLEYVLVPRPYSRLYALYIISMIDLANGEYNKYNISSAAFNDAMRDYAKWYIRSKSR